MLNSLRSPMLGLASAIATFVLIYVLIEPYPGPPLLAGETASPTPDLFPAIRSGDDSNVAGVLKRGADIKARDEHGNTPLIAAAANGQSAIVKLLLKAGADVNATNAAGVSALMRAATFQDTARILLAAGALVSPRSGLGNTALILSARKLGNAGTVRLLIDRGAEVNATNVFGATALMSAVAADDIDSTQLLLDHGANINACPSMNGDGFIWGGGRTPLMWAAYNGNATLVRLLLKRGAKVDAFSLIGGPLTQAAWGNHVEVAQLLIDAGAPINQRDLIANYTPLHWAASAERSSPALTQLLLGRGAEVNVEGGQPVDNFLGATATPLSLARKRGDTPIVQALLKAGGSDGSSIMPAHPLKTAGAVAARGEGDPVAAAIERALKPLTKTAEGTVKTFRQHASKQDCISCHQQQLPLMALSVANGRHLPVDRSVIRRQVELLKRFISDTTSAEPRSDALEVNWQTTFHPEPAIVSGYASFIFDLENQPSSPGTDAMVHHLATIQHADGHWNSNLPRPPIQASPIGATALAMHVIKHFMIPARRTELEECLQRGRTWLRKVNAETSEERVHQLLGLAWAGETSGRLKKLGQRLSAKQRADGGWAQLEGLESDAYATGQSLYALMNGGGMSPNNPVIQRGVDFLLRTQLGDGTWHVQRRAHPFQPPMDSGFAHGADGWISGAGTSWAVLALCSALDPAQATRAQMVSAGASNDAAVVPASVPAQAARNAMAPVDFARDIRPILERSCVNCHSGERPKGGFAMTDRATLLRGGARGEAAIVPGNPEASPLIRMVQDQLEDLEMPPLGKRKQFPSLSGEEIVKLKAWVTQGALWTPGATLQQAKK